MPQECLGNTTKAHAYAKCPVPSGKAGEDYVSKCQLLVILRTQKSTEMHGISSMIRVLVPKGLKPFVRGLGMTVGSGGLLGDLDV